MPEATRQVRRHLFGSAGLLRSAATSASLLEATIAFGRHRSARRGFDRPFGPSRRDAGLLAFDGVVPVERPYALHVVAELHGPMPPCRHLARPPGPLTQPLASSRLL